MLLISGRLCATAWKLKPNVCRLQVYVQFVVCDYERIYYTCVWFRYSGRRWDRLRMTDL